MVKVWLQIQGQRWIDSLVLWINGAFWLPRRWYYTYLYGSKEKAWYKLMEEPHKHWTMWPFRLSERRYRYQKGPFVDGTGLIWFVAREQGDTFPHHWLSCLQSSKVGLDIGAHRGYWTLYHASYLAPDSEVLLLEADYTNYRYLLSNIASNRLPVRFYPLYGAA
ncbi:MAG: hypothetical protein N3E49_07965 [Bacteroidia bacterium]|nr:hypothetical protein [Bacteroidia bacterium]